MGPVVVEFTEGRGDLDHEPRPVGVRVGPDHQVERFHGIRAVLFDVRVNGDLGRRGIARVRLLFRMVLKGGEESVELVQPVAGYRVHPGETKITQQTGHRLASGPVKRAVPDPDGRRPRLHHRGVGNESTDLVLVHTVDIDEGTTKIVESWQRLGAAQEHEPVSVAAGVIGVIRIDPGVIEVQEGDLVRSRFPDVVVVDDRSFPGRKLRSRPGGKLVAIVSSVVMARRDQDAHVGAQRRYGEGHFRVRAGFVEEVDFQPLGEEHSGYQPGEILARHPAVVADDDGPEPMGGRVLRDARGLQQENDVVEGIRPLEDGGVHAVPGEDQQFFVRHGGFAAYARRAELDLVHVGFDQFVPPGRFDGASQSVAEPGGQPADVRVGQPAAQIRNHVQTGLFVEPFVDQPAAELFFEEAGDPGIRLPNDGVVVDRHGITRRRYGPACASSRTGGTGRCRPSGRRGCRRCRGLRCYRAESAFPAAGR